MGSLGDINRSDGQTRQLFGLVGHATLSKLLNLLGLSVLDQNTRDNDAHLPGLLWRVTGRTSLKAPSIVPAQNGPL